jgi:hypothetical protein
MKKLLILILSLITFTLSAKEKVNWIKNPQNNHYYAVIDARNWQEANQFARQNGAHLVTFETLSEIDFIRKTFSKSEYFWIGMDNYKGQFFYYVTGQEKYITFFGANRGTPISPNYRIYMNSINARGFTRGEFNQAPLHNKFRAIIEKE